MRTARHSLGKPVGEQRGENAKIAHIGRDNRR